MIDPRYGKQEAAAAFSAAARRHGMEAHHPLRKQFLLREARTRLRNGELEEMRFWWEVYPPEIAVMLDPRRHEQHTNRTQVIPLEELPTWRWLCGWAARRGPHYVEELLREHPPADPASADYARSLTNE